MSIAVDHGRLAATIEDYGPGYLLTVSPDAAIKAVMVEPVTANGTIVIEAPGNSSVRNIGHNPTVTVLFPPTEPKGFSLLVDGTAHADGDTVTITPTSAVLHRPAAHADGPPPPDGCGHDCAPL